MEIEVKQEKLAKALNNVSRVAVGGRSMLPVLNNVLIRVDDGRVSLTTTNLDMAIIDYLPVSESKNGVVTLPARLLAEFVSNLPRGEVVKIKAKDTKVNIVAGKYASMINGASADDFPELPDVNEDQAVVFKMGVEDFKSGINQVVVASSNDTTRPALTGVYFNTNEKVLAVAATDGYRLAERQLIKNVESEVSAIVPANALQEVMRSISDDMEEIEISFNEDLVRFRLGEVEIVSKLIDASYPDYRKLIPKDNEIQLTLAKDELMRVTKLAALFAKQVGGCIVCETKTPDKMIVKSVANEFGENDSAINTEVDVDGKVVLNSRFLIDAINALEDEEMEFIFSNNPTPVILKNKKKADYLHIIMPINK